MIVLVKRNGQRVPCQTSADFWREFSQSMPPAGPKVKVNRKRSRKVKSVRRF